MPKDRRRRLSRFLGKLTNDSTAGGEHTPYWDSVGNPAMSIPMGFGVDGKPLGLQIAGRAFDDTTVLRASDAFQECTE